MTPLNETQTEGESHKVSRMEFWLERLMTPIAATAGMMCTTLPDVPEMPRVFGHSPLRVGAAGFFLLVVARAFVAAIRYAHGHEVAMPDLVAWKLLTWGFAASVLYILVSELLGR